MKILRRWLSCGVVMCALGLSGTAAAERQKIIFDCDLAGDIDDAFALALILASPELEVLGITVGHGDTQARARVACRMLYEVGREDIPVMVGRATAIIVGEEQELAPPSHQAAWGEGFDRVRPSEEPAADFILRMLHEQPHEIVLLTVGPVSNIQDVLERDPEALKLAKRVVSMFGSFYRGYNDDFVPAAEWNVRADVEAAKRFAASGAAIVYAGLDVTTFVKLDEASRQRLLLRNSPLTDAVCGLYSLWLDEEYAVADPTMFDGVAVGMLLWPELFTTRPAHVRVLDGGYTTIDESQPSNAEVAMSIRKDEFLRRMMQRLLRQNLLRPEDRSASASRTSRKSG